MSRPEHSGAQNDRRDSFSRLKIGQRVELNVLRSFEGGGYLVSLAGSQHVMDSAVPLAVGGRIRAVVVAVGDRLELRYVDSSESQSASDDFQPEIDRGTRGAPPTLLAGLEEKYRITLGSDDEALLQRAMAGAADPTAMALGGIYLAKVGAAISSVALDALHDAQRSPIANVPTGGVVRDISAWLSEISEGDSQSATELADVLAGAMPLAGTGAGLATTDGGSADAGSADAGDQRELARQLLNLQDGGSIVYGYGSLPVIVAGQLVELDLVVLQQRSPAPQGSSPVRRLAMTVQTQSFGRLRIEASALDNRLIVNFTGQSPQGAAELSEYRDEVRDLLGRLGWNVEAIGYELDGRPTTAARHVIDHVLSAGTVNLVV
jgi:hypothetical protein